MDKLTRLLDLYLFHLDMWLPLHCRCGHWVWHKWQAKAINVTAGGVVLLCPKCYQRAHEYDRKLGYR